MLCGHQVNILLADAATPSDHNSITCAGSNEPDLAVFRFTLGIPGFDDANIPRVIGVLCLLLLVLNHIFGSSSPAPAQVGPRGLVMLEAAAAF